MIHNEKVTVVTITYNLINAGRKEYFRQCVESVHSQSYKNIEHIIIDGASTDGTLDLIKAYADKGWLTYHSEKDEGVYHAMNKGIDKAGGEYINFLNSDDYFSHPDGIKLSVKYLTAANADFSFASCTFLDSKNKYLGILKPVIESFLFRLPSSHQTMVVRKDILLKLNKFDEQFNSASDFDLVLRLCLSGAKYIEVPLNFVSYRLGGLSFVNQKQSIDEYAKSCINNLNKYSHHDVNTYKRMYSELLLPKILYDEIIKDIDHKYRFYLTDLVNNHSENHNEYYKITKYPKLTATNNMKHKINEVLKFFFIPRE